MADLPADVERRRIAVEIAVHALALAQPPLTAQQLGPALADMAKKIDDFLTKKPG